MKKIYAGIFILIFTVTVAGQICRHSFLDIGIAGLKTEEDIENLDCGLYYIFGHTAENEEILYQSFTQYRSAYLAAPDLAPVIIIGTATGSYSQDSYSFGQEVSVDRILKGSGIVEHETYFIYGTDGFTVDTSGRPVYTNIKNIMKKGCRYLIFLEPSDLNQYQQIPKAYSLFGGYFSYLHLADIESEPIKESLDSLRLNQIMQNEFFASSERILSCIQEIKEELVVKYCGDEVS